MLKNPLPIAQRKLPAKFQHLVFFVNDMAKMDNFYKTIFRLNFSADNSRNTSAIQRIGNQSMNFYSFGYYHHDLAFCQNRNIQSEVGDILCFTVELKEDETIDALIATLEEEGVAYRNGRILPSNETPNGFKAICFQDPTGRWIEVIGR